MSANETPLPKLPIRAWLGWRREDIIRSRFVDQLGDLFLPMTIHVGRDRLGSLAGYSAAVMPGNLGSVVPDETALVFYKSIPDYVRTMATLEGRGYQTLHGALFDLTRSSTKDFPVLLGDSLLLDTNPYYAYSNVEGIDRWQAMTTRMMIGLRMRSLDQSLFKVNLFDCLRGLQKKAPTAEGALIVRASRDFVVAWQLGDPAANGDHLEQIADLPSVQSIWTAEAKQVAVPADLNTADRWLNVSPGDFLRFQFPLAA
jgi:hypothetical protein